MHHEYDIYAQNKASKPVKQGTLTVDSDDCKAIGRRVCRRNVNALWLSHRSVRKFSGQYSGEKGLEISLGNEEK